MRRPGLDEAAQAGAVPQETAGDRLPVPASDGGSAVFRETFLLWVTDPALNRALRVLAKALCGMVQEHARHWPALPGSMDYWDLRAVAGDLRHIQGVLDRITREPAEPEGEARTADGFALFTLAGTDAAAVAMIADQLERDLEGCQTGEPGA